MVALNPLPSPLPPFDALERAVAACLRALIDYQTGLLDEEQLRRTLYHGGIVLGDGEAWLLDVSGGCWRRYDGIGAEPFPDPAAVPGGRVFHGDTLRRWQDGLRALAAEVAASGSAVPPARTV